MIQERNYETWESVASKLNTYNTFRKLHARISGLESFSGSYLIMVILFVNIL
jgi:hypothetical protein